LSKPPETEPRPAAGELLARVVVSEPLPPLDYLLPAALAAQVRKGVPVLVPLRKRRTSAYVVEVHRGPPPEGVTLKEVLGVDPERPPLPPQLVDLVLFAASYYAVREGEMLATALPALARLATATYVVTPEGRDALAAGEIDERSRALVMLAAELPRGFTVAAVEKRFGLSRRTAAAELTRAAARGWLGRRQKKAGRKERVTVERLAGDETALARRPALAAVYAALPAEGRVVVAELEGRGAAQKLRDLEKLGLVRRHHEVVVGAPVAQSGWSVGAASTPQGDITLTPAQAEAVVALEAAVTSGRFHSYLLEGVTGSGKTEVYLRAIARALDSGKSALVLVPEIALTPQLGDIFAGRFGAQVAIFHSGLTAAERRDEWERVARGDARIGLGARSALFLPLAELGLIVVDEEHENTFKQEESPRYNARDLAVVRAKAEGAVVVLGSATPSLESRQNAETGRYIRLALPSRVQARPMPQVERIDLTVEPRPLDGMLTTRLVQALEATFTAGDQAILYLNRRGFAPYVFCRDCGHAYRCVDCDVALTLHRRRDALVCHYCGYEEPAPDECSQCHGHKVAASGVGLEKLEAELHELFGPMPIARLDRDNVRTRAHLVAELTRFRSGEAKLLIGTQMVTKGHDFPGVTLVGVVLADGSLNFPDFRAAERTFQLLTQVGGAPGAVTGRVSCWCRATTSPTTPSRPRAATTTRPSSRRSCRPGASSATRRSPTWPCCASRAKVRRARAARRRLPPRSCGRRPPARRHGC
jgi:primosomal protein N' (replication factor Y)